MGDMANVNELLLAALNGEVEVKYSAGADTPDECSWGFKVASIPDDLDRVIWHWDGGVYITAPCDVACVLMREKNRARKAKEKRNADKT